MLLVGGCSSGDDGRAGSPDCSVPAGRTEIIELADQPDLPGRDAVVHLPPCYDETDERYPTVYLLHGAGLSPESWARDPVDTDDIADRLSIVGDIDPVILVMPPRSIKRTGFVDAVLEPLMIEVETRFRTIESPQGRAIGGFSASGSAVAQSAFTGDPRFGAVAFFAVTWPESMAAEVADGMADRNDRPSVLATAGDRDRLQRRIPDIEEALEAVGITTEVSIVPGDHSVAFVAEQIDDWLIWFDQRLDEALG